MNLNKFKKIDIIDNWFKLTIRARKPKKGEPEVDYSYTTGLHKEIVRREVQESLGSGYFVEAAPIKYKQMIREISKFDEMH